MPTMAESGYTQLGFDPDAWTAIFAPPGTPAAIIKLLNAKINESLATADMRAAFDRMGIDIRSGTTEDLVELLARHVTRWPEILRLANVQPPT